MNIAVISWLKGKPITPDLKYGGIEHMTRNMALAFQRAGHSVTLFAPPGSEVKDIDVICDTDFWRVLRYINNDSNIDFVYDNTCWDSSSPVRQSINKPFASTTHVMHACGWSKNVIYLSYSQRKSHSEQLSKKLRNPIIPVPAPNIDPVGYDKEDYLLFLGAAAFHKGLHNAVELAHRLRRDLIVAGPAWGEYVEAQKKPHVHFIGEVYGDEKWKLLEQAYAVCALSDGSQGWVEPGAGVVAEANVVGTPVAALNNGCLPEIVFTGANGWIADTVKGVEFHMNVSPYLEDVSLIARTTWNVDRIANSYLNVFRDIMNGATYD